MYGILVILLALPIGLYFFFKQKSGSAQGSFIKPSASNSSELVSHTPSKKTKAKAKKQANKAETVTETVTPKQPTVETTKEKKISSVATKAAPAPGLVAASDASSPAKKNKKKKKATKAENKLESAAASVDSPAPTPELIHEEAPENTGADSEPSDFVEATKSKKKKNKKSKVAKNETPVITESILPEPKETIEFIDESEFTKPSKASVAKPSNRYVKGLSERKPVESANPWALLAEE